MDKQKNEDEIVEAMAKAMLEVYQASSFNNHANMEFCRQQARVQYRAFVAMYAAVEEQIVSKVANTLTGK